MIRYLFISLLLTISTFIFSCKSKKDICTEVIENSLNFKIIKNDLSYSNFTKEVKNISYLETLTIGNIRIIAFTDSSTYKIYLFDSIFKQKFADTIKIKSAVLLKKNDFLYLFDRNSKKLLKLSNTFNQPIRIIDSLEIERTTEMKKYFVIDNQSTKLIEINKKFTFIYNYGIYKKENINYLDKNCFFYSLGGKEFCIGKNLTDYKNNYLPKRNSYFTIDTSNNIYYINAYSDKLCKMNIAGNEIASVNLSQCLQFRNFFNKKEMMNLAYTRKYIAENEQNLQIEMLNNNTIAILKKSSQKQVIDEPTYKLSIFDLNLKRKSTQEIKFQIRPKMFVFNGEIVLFSTDFTKSYVYEIN